MNGTTMAAPSLKWTIVLGILIRKKDGNHACAADLYGFTVSGNTSSYQPVVSARTNRRARQAAIRFRE
ncbi:MAG: hypothetical protein HP491_19795 [Nitrospira sp.]|nr:hypothetical protein [Nitrospira sp.]MBH0183338.1 hypothetical protein [Nitrospira sp.]MBH0197563.1 hypothetical protein [Nitrospira sp.]